jgi:hypothetical protein
MKKILGIICCILIIFLAGCNGSSSKNPADNKLQTGTKGVTTEFMKNSLQQKIYENSEFYLRFQLHNQGFEHIKNGILVPQVERDLIEIQSWEFSEALAMGPENSALFRLHGKTVTDQKGEKTIATLQLNAKTIEDTRNKLPSTIALSMCYPYATIFSETICIDTDPEGVSIAKKSCTAKDISSSSGQGAPIAITKVEQSVMPGDSDDSVVVQFNVYAENKGSGLIIDYDRYRDICLAKNPQKEDYDTIWVHSFKFSDYEYKEGNDYSIDCYPNPMRLTQNGYYTQCTVKKESAISRDKLTFETPLVIELLYGYKETIGTEIEILNRYQEMN